MTHAELIRLVLGPDCPCECRCHLRVLPSIVEPVTIHAGGVVLSRSITSVCDACDLAFDVWNPRGNGVQLRRSYPYRINIRIGKRRKG